MRKIITIPAAMQVIYLFIFFFFYCFFTHFYFCFYFLFFFFFFLLFPFYFPFILSGCNKPSPPSGSPRLVSQKSTKNDQHTTLSYRFFC